MALYDMTDLASGTPVTKESLVKLVRTSFAVEQIQERAHLQAAIRDHIDLVDEDLLVVAEEFGDFEGAARRIDLLCIERDGRLVVVELKRTSDGGHMELQAIRYAAMISTMTFSFLVRTFSRYRKERGAEDDSEDTARDDLIEWLDWEDDGEEPVISREVGIVLVSEDFSSEITTTVLWLNEFHGFDIRCVRLSPYKLENRLLLDVQQVIPLPEAADYTIRVRRKEAATVRQAQGPSNQDHTKFVVKTPDKTWQPLPKRWAVLRLVQALVDVGIDLHELKSVIGTKFVVVDGHFEDPDQLWEAMENQLQKNPTNRPRWHLDDPMHSADRTWVLNNNWGNQTRELIKQLLELAPADITAYEDGAITDPSPSVQNQAEPPRSAEAYAEDTAPIPVDQRADNDDFVIQEIPEAPQEPSHQQS